MITDGNQWDTIVSDFQFLLLSGAQVNWIATFSIAFTSIFIKGRKKLTGNLST